MAQTGTQDAAAPGTATGGDILTVTGVEVVYNDVIRVLHGVSLQVPRGSIVAILGANGAGKTTLLRAITGLLPHHRGEIVKGRITLAGRDITGRDPADIVRAGVAQVMEGRHTFAELSVDDNLRAGAVTVKDRDLVKQRYERVMELFPVLKDRRNATAGYLSGGEQQMLVIARALMSGPELMLLDEPSLGLAPMLVEQIAGIVRDLNTEDGTSILLVEQNASMALNLADHGYVMETGRIVRDAPADELLEDEDIRDFYLGGHAGDRNFRDVKTYRRRRRWA